MDDFTKFKKNPEIIRIINVASNVFQKILESELYIKEQNNKNFLKENDKLILSLFLSLIYNNNELTQLLEENNGSFESILKTVNYKGKNEEIFKYYSDAYEFEKKLLEILYNSFMYNNYESDYIPLIILATMLKTASYDYTILDKIICSFSECSTKIYHYAFETKFYIGLSKILDSKELKIFEEEVKKQIKTEDIIDNELDSINKFLGIDIMASANKTKQQFLESIQEEDEEETQLPNLLENYGYNLTKQQFLSNPAIGRELTLRNLMVALLTPEKSPILVGEPGVGKTAIVEALAYLIQKNQVPTSLQNKKIIKLNISSIISGTKYVGVLEEKMEELLTQLKEDQEIILFIDEIHGVIGAGSTSSDKMDISNILKPYLDRGQITLIGATTTNEYNEHVASDAAFKRRFETILVEEPEKQMVYTILEIATKKYENLKKIEFSFEEEIRIEILKILVELTQKNNRNHLDYVNNPDLALTFLGKAFAFAALDSRKKIKISDIIESINSSNRVIESAKVKFTTKLKKLNEVKFTVEEQSDNIITLKKKK